MRDMRGEVGKKTPKKEMDNGWLIFKTLYPVIFPPIGVQQTDEHCKL